LFLAYKGVLVLGLGLKNHERESAGVQQKEIDIAALGLLEVFAEVVEVGGPYRDRRLQPDVGRGPALGEEAPPAASSSLLILILAVASFMRRTP
jgi:hypothetical protein